MNPLYEGVAFPKPTEESGPYIRLLRLGRLECQLEVFPLRLCPAYKALSYCWGDLDDTVPLHCNHHQLQITRNLHLALEQLYSEYSGQLLWIDAVCINQHNKAEQSDQVGFMRKIYSCAEEVLIWLGPSTIHKDVPHILSTAKSYAQRLRLVMQLIASAGVRNSTWIRDRSIDLTVTRDRIFTGSDMDGLICILRQPYWTRLWIIQEVCAAKTARIHVGKHSIEWDDFNLVLAMMERCLPWVLIDMGPNFRALIQLRTSYQAEDEIDSQIVRPGLAELLVQFRWSRATIPMDKIYGLLGLAPDSEHGLVRIDYTMSPVQCYTQAMLSLIRQSRDLTLLIYCNPPRFVRRDPILPSWVPDWSYDVSNLSPPRLGLTEPNPYHRLGDVKGGMYQGYRASGNSECPTPIVCDGPNQSVLSLCGMTVGRISELCRPMELHHLPLRVEKNSKIFEPLPPVSQQEFVDRHWSRLIWSFLTDISLARFLLFPMNCYRKGKALDILLESAELANSPGTWIGQDGSPLKVLFITLVKGDQDDKFTLDRILPDTRNNTVEEMASELRRLQKSLRWNPILRFVSLTGIAKLFPILYFSLLGLSYDHLRGAFHLRGIIIATLNWIAVVWKGSLPVPDFVWMVAMAYGYQVTLQGLSTPAWPMRLELALTSFLDYALARTQEGHLALVPHNARTGDEIALLKGGKCPFVVRRQKSHWLLVGDAFVHGMMEGERWEEGACQQMDFV